MWLEQVLLWRGLEELDDSLTINDYYISDRSTLHVMPRSYYQKQEMNSNEQQEDDEQREDAEGEDHPNKGESRHYPCSALGVAYSFFLPQTCSQSVLCPPSVQPSTAPGPE